MSCFPKQKFTGGNEYNQVVQRRRASKREKVQDDNIWQDKKKNDQMKSGRWSEKRFERKEEVLRTCEETSQKMTAAWERMQVQEGNGSTAKEWVLFSSFILNFSFPKNNLGSYLHSSSLRCSVPELEKND